jgi:hypothetical protein
MRHEGVDSPVWLSNVCGLMVHSRVLIMHWQSCVIGFGGRLVASSITVLCAEMFKYVLISSSVPNFTAVEHKGPVDSVVLGFVTCTLGDGITANSLAKVEGSRLRLT